MPEIFYHLLPLMLTPQEKQVLTLIAEGETNKSIAYNFQRSIKTVEKQRVSLMRKLNIRHIAGLTKYAILHGYTSL